MGDDVFSLLSSAIEHREEISCKMGGIPIKFCPYVLYELNGKFWAAGLRMPSKISVYIPVTELQDIATTGHFFHPDRAFNLDDPRYDNAVAMIETSFHNAPEVRTATAWLERVRPPAGDTGIAAELRARYMEGFGARLAARTRELGWNPAEVAHRAGLSQFEFNCYVEEERTPDLRTLIVLAKVLGTSTDRLLGLAGSPKALTLRDEYVARIDAALSQLSEQDLELIVIQLRALAHHRHAAARHPRHAQSARQPAEALAPAIPA